VGERKRGKKSLLVTSVKRTRGGRGEDGKEKARDSSGIVIMISNEYMSQGPAGLGGGGSGRMQNCARQERGTAERGIQAAGKGLLRWGQSNLFHKGCSGRKIGEGGWRRWKRETKQKTTKIHLIGAWTLFQSMSCRQTVKGVLEAL